MAEKGSRWLRDYEVSEASGGRYKVSTLRKDRLGAQRYPFHRIGRMVYYDLQELDAEIEKSRFGGSTATKRQAA